MVAEPLGQRLHGYGGQTATGERPSAAEVQSSAVRAITLPIGAMAIRYRMDHLHTEAYGGLP